MKENDLSVVLAQWATSFTSFMADRRGVPLMLGFLLVVLNFILQFVPTLGSLGWFIEYDVLLHLGVLLAIGGSLLSTAL